MLIQRLRCLIVRSVRETSHSACNDELPHKQHYTGVPNLYIGSHTGNATPSSAQPTKEVQGCGNGTAFPHHFSPDYVKTWLRSHRRASDMQIRTVSQKSTVKQEDPVLKFL